MKITQLRTLANRHGVIVVVFLFVLVTLLPLFLRGLHDDPLIIGEQSYVHLRHAEGMLHGNMAFDTLRNERFLVTPHLLLLAFFDTLHLDWLLPILLGIAFIFLVERILSRMEKGSFVVLTTLAILVISPAMSVLTTHHDPVLLAMVLLLGAVLLIETRLAIACLLLVLGIISSPAIGVFTSLILLAISVRKKQHVRGITVGMSVVVAIVWYAMWLFSLPTFSFITKFQNVFFEFGVPGGISIFFLFIAVYGFLTGKIKNKNWLSLLAGVLLLLSTSWQFVLAATMLLSYFAAYGVRNLATVVWEQEILRHLTIILILCVSIFIVAVSATQRMSELPDANFVQVMQQIGDDRHGGLVLTDPLYAGMVEYFSGRPVTLPVENKQVMQQVFSSRQVENIYSFLDQTDTGYIFIDDRMQERLFSYSEDGLLFVLPNTKRFVVLLDTGNMKVWYYIKRDGG